MYQFSRVAPTLAGIGCALALVACSDTGSSDRATGLGTRLVVSVSPRIDTVVVGATRQLSASVTDGSGALQNMPVSWSTTAPAIASVSTSGIVSAVAPGTAQIVASSGASADSATIVVRATEEFRVEPSIVSIPLGDQLQFTVSSAMIAALRSAASSTAPIRWSMSDSTIAMVDENGVVTTTGLGDVTLKASVGTASGSATIAVKQNTIGSIRISPTNSSINAKTSEQLAATLLDDNGRVIPGTVNNWSSSNTSVATVSSAGLVTGVARGSVIVTARVASKRATATVNILDVPVATVDVSAPATTVAIGQTLQAATTLKDADGNVLTGRVVSWQSSNPALATVTSKGVVTGIAAGDVTISAICEGKVGTLAISVVANSVASVTITPANGTAVVGQSAQLKADALDASRAVILGKTFTWQSSNPAIATVSSTGVVSTVAVGTTTITATTDGISGTSSFTVTSVPVSWVAVQPSSVKLIVGSTAQLTSSGADASGGSLTQRVTQWSSAEPTIATVSTSGMVTAVRAGTASIKATVDGVSATSSVEVDPPPPAPVASITVALASVSLTAGQTTQATATLRDSAGNALTGRTITWSSSDQALATVSATGLVTAVAAGSTTIIATAEEKTGSASLTVTPAAPAPVASVSLSAPNTTLTVGQSTQVNVVIRDAGGNALTGRVVAWKSTSPAIATVTANGVVNAIATGTTTIQATSEGVTGTLNFSVTGGGPGPVATVTLSTSASALTVGQTSQVVATARDASGTVVPNAVFSWSSTNTGVLIVSPTGMVTAVAGGSAQVRATSGAAVGTLAMSVTDPTPPPPPPSGPLPVIPGVVGFGTTTPAGRGGTVYRVTNLNDNGTGSLRAALQASGPRVVVFEVSGTIALSSKLTVNNPYLTVAGQTAPAPGILLRNYGISIRTHDVLVQHLRIRVGNLGSAGNNDAWEVLGPGGYNIVGDHLSLSWAQDENASTWYGGVHDVTVTNSIISEALRGAEDGLGMLVGDSTKNYAVINSLMASNQERNPYFKGGTTGISANNVVYNWGGNQAAYTADDYGSGPSQIAVVGNVFIRGPSTAAGRPIQLYSSAKPGSKLYVADNSDGRGAAPPSDAWSLVRNDYGSAGVASSAPVWPSGFTPRANSQVYSYVLANAGAWPASRDAVDARVVGNVKNGNGSVINSQADVGGWPSLASTTRTLTLPANPNGDDNGNGYTNLEEWLQGLARAAEGR